MIAIGITGGIGSGKTMVAQIVQSMGYQVYNADLEARNIIDTHPSAITQIKALFGNSIYVNGKLDRARVASLVFSNSELLAKLNSIAHPLVGEHFRQWKASFSTEKIVFKEAAILFESGAYKQVDKVVAVIAPEQLRVERVCKRDGIKPEQVMERIRKQLPSEELKRRSDFIIVNDENYLLVPQVVTIIDKILENKDK